MAPNDEIKVLTVAVLQISDAKFSEKVNRKPLKHRELERKKK